MLKTENQVKEILKIKDEIIIKESLTNENQEPEAFKNKNIENKNRLHTCNTCDKTSK